MLVFDGSKFRKEMGIFNNFMWTYICNFFGGGHFALEIERNM